MTTSQLDVVTGAFGYTGKYITHHLLARGRQVRTLTAHPNRPNPFGSRVSAAALDFSRPDQLAESLRGAQTLYNTYWVRFSHGEVSFKKAVENSRILVEAARQAGVARIVHLSITNPSLDSPLPYFSGKARVEKIIRDSGLSYALLRPTVIFGKEDILINNIAWFLRNFPVFFIPGDGNYRLQPVYVDDLAQMAVEAGQGEENLVLDAVGPDILTFNELVRVLRTHLHSKTRLVHLPAKVALASTRLLGLAVGDVVLTREEVQGLMANLLISNDPPTGHTRLCDWAAQNARDLGRQYSSELKRHYR